MSESPKWCSLIDSSNRIRRRRIDNLQVAVWHPPDGMGLGHATRGCKIMRTRRTHFELGLSEFSPPIHDADVANTNATNESGLSITDDSDNGTPSDREPDVAGIESEGSESDEERRDENALRHEDTLNFVLNSDSDDGRKGSHEDQVSVGQVSRPRVGTKSDSLISALERAPHMVDPLEVPTRKELRTALSSRLATLVRRVRSDRVVRLHTHTTDCDADNDRAEVFTAKLAFFPFTSRSIPGHVVATVADGDVIVVSTALLSESQWEHLKGADVRRCSLLVALTPPWREIVVADVEQRQRRVIYSPSCASVQVLPEETDTLVLQSIPLLCDCIEKDATGSTWYSCANRFGCKAAKLSTGGQLGACGSGQMYVLVLQKSLLWFQKRLKIACLVKLSNGSLSMLLFPQSVCRRWSLGGDGDGGGTSGRMKTGAMMNPGCVYGVKASAAFAAVSDAGLARKAQRLWSGGLTDLVKRREGLSRFVALDDAPDEVSIFLVKKAAKLHLVLEMTAFAETAVYPPYSPLLSSSSRCVLTGVLLYEFASGSLMAERILAGNGDSAADEDEHKLSSVLAILTESTGCGDVVHLVLCSGDAVTPVTVLIGSDHLSPCAGLDYGQHRSYRVRVSIVGAIVARDYFIVDEFSRVELTEVARLSEGHLDGTRNYPLAGRDEDLRERNASLVTMAGRVVAVDAASSQVWPLCTGCLSDALQQKLPAAKPSGTHLECCRCEARIDRPFYATEIFVEVTDTVQRRRFKVCMLPSCFAEMSGLSEAQIYQSSFLNPGLLIGQSVNIPLGLWIKLPELEESQVALSDCGDVVIQLHPNMLT